MVLYDLLVLEPLPPTGRYSVVERNVKDKWLVLGRRKVPEDYGGETFR